MVAKLYGSGARQKPNERTGGLMWTWGRYKGIIPAAPLELVDERPTGA